MRGASGASGGAAPGGGAWTVEEAGVSACGAGEVRTEVRVASASRSRNRCAVAGAAGAWPEKMSVAVTPLFPYNAAFADLSMAMTLPSRAMPPNKPRVRA